MPALLHTICTIFKIVHYILPRLVRHRANWHTKVISQVTPASRIFRLLFGNIPGAIKCLAPPPAKDGCIVLVIQLDAASR